MNTTEPSVRQKLEASLAAYVRSNSDTTSILVSREGSPLNGLPVYTGQIDAKWQEPCVIISCERSQRLWGSWSECIVQARVITALAESETGTAQLQSDRFGALVDLLADDVEDGDDKPRLAKLLSKPATGDDERQVKGLTVIGFFPDNEDGVVSDKHWDDLVTFRFHCMPCDPS